jgi:hypothetical protein
MSTCVLDVSYLEEMKDQDRQLRVLCAAFTIASGLKKGMSSLDHLLHSDKQPSSTSGHAGPALQAQLRFCITQIIASDSVLTTSVAATNKQMAA